MTINSRLSRRTLLGTVPGAMLCAVLRPESLRSAHAVEEQSRAEESIFLGKRRELFVDRFLIASLDNAILKMHSPHDEGPVLKFEYPWEGPMSGYVTMMQLDKKYRMYYRGISEPGLDGSDHERTCVAESPDGVNWIKPAMGFFEFAGNKDNNVVLANAAPLTHNLCPFLDTRPSVDPAERFKAVGGTGTELHALVSSDGLRWKRMQEGPILSKDQMTFRFDHLFDSQNLVFWSTEEQCYVCYFRVWDGVRRIARSTSQDFRQWSPAEMMTHWHDAGDGSGPQPAPVEHLYTNQTSPYQRAPHIAIAIAARFFPDRRVLTDSQAAAIGVDPRYFGDTSDAILMTTRGGSRYDRTFLEGFLRPGIGPENWVSRTNYPALNLLQTSDSELSLYVNQNYAQPTAHVRRYSLRLDGFSSLHAGIRPGTLVTKPFRFTGSKLGINFSTSAGGSLKIEMQDAQGTAIPGYQLDDCQEQIGNEIDRVVTWKRSESVMSLKDSPVRMKIVLKDADLYSFHFAD